MAFRLLTLLGPHEGRGKMKEFKDIKVTGIDERVTNINEQGNSNIHLTLSPSNDIPEEWRDLFDNAWNSYKYNVWVNAEARGKYIIIHCHHSTLHKDHMANIENAVVKANEEYLVVHQQKKVIAEQNKNHIKKKADIMSGLQNGFKKP